MAKYYLERSQTNEPCHTLFKEIARNCDSILQHLPDFGGGTSVGRVAISAIATNVIQVAVISDFRLSAGYSEVRECPQAFERLTACLKLLQGLVKLPAALRGSDERSANEPRLACSSLMKAYFIAGTLVANDGGQFPFLREGSKLMEQFPQREDSIVTIYDPWRYDQLEVLCWRHIDNLNSINGR